ncbi:DUF2188 domain-containing protein [Cupriavidus necator]
MSVSTVQVTISNAGRWAVEADDGREPVTYPSRAAAVAAGVHLAVAEDAVLMIHGVSEEPSAIDFSCDAKLVD